MAYTGTVVRTAAGLRFRPDNEPDRLFEITQSSQAFAGVIKPIDLSPYEGKKVGLTIVRGAGNIEGSRMIYGVTEIAVISQ